MYFIVPERFFFSGKWRSVRINKDLSRQKVQLSGNPLGSEGNQKESSYPRTSRRIDSFHRNDLWLILAILIIAGAVALGLVLKPEVEDNTLRASLLVQGVEVWAADLRGLKEPITYTLQTADGELTVEADSQGAAIIYSTCQDQVCVHQGKITEVNQAAVCLPLKSVLRLEGETVGINQPDVVSR